MGLGRRNDLQASPKPGELRDNGLVPLTAHRHRNAPVIARAVDRETWFPLMAGVQRWGPTPWIQPWHPPNATSGAQPTAGGSAS